MRLEGKKVGILIESDFYEGDVSTTSIAFPKRASKSIGCRASGASLR